MQPNDELEYYRKREADERTAAEKADPVVQQVHLDLAELYAARLQASSAAE